MILVGIIAMLSYLINEKDEVVRAVIFIMSCKDMAPKKELWTAFTITAVGSVLLSCWHFWESMDQ